MRNLERIKNMSIKELAIFLTRAGVERDVDYDYDENPIETCVDVWICPDGVSFYDMCQDMAIAHTEQWLKSEFKKADEGGE